MFQGLFIDGFAGGGGASTGIEQAIGRSVDIAINHSPTAIADERWPRERHFTFVNPKAVANSNPGRCFVHAGWRYQRARLDKFAPRAVSKRRKLLILERLPADEAL